MEDIIKKADNFVLELFKEKLSNSYIYHNYNHTLRVVKSTKELIENSQLNVKEEQALTLAAWLHDTGYTVKFEGHEEESVIIAREFLMGNKVEEEIIQMVEECILATKFDNKPNTKLEYLIRDADSSHLAKEYFLETSEFLRQELLLLNINEYSPSDWLDENIKLFTEKHNFYTPYAVKNWKAQKDKNLSELLEKQNKERQKLKKEETKARLKAEHKNNNPERSIQTLFRVTLRNHIALSEIADTKANILLSVNAIIISLALANLIPQLDAATHKHLLIPTLILIVFSVASIILSIMSTRPNVTSGEFTRDQVEKREVNLLFFGNFHKMPFEQFKWGLTKLIQDKDYVYESMMLDLHSLGIVLQRKYLLLRLTYMVFMIGIIISVLGYVVAFYLI
ncbi:hypothetical protein BH23BAC2_BH23BAC2_09480 [soil metagenome]